MLPRGWRRKQREHQRRRQQPFRSAADTLGIDVGRSGRKLSGEVESRRVRYSYWPASESGSGSACRVAYAGGPLGIKLKIHRRANGWRRSAVTTGDETFDGLMLVKTNDPDRLSLALDASVTRQILDLAFDGRLRITDKIISLTEQIKDPTAAAIVATILRLIAVAEAVERARPASGRSP